METKENLGVRNVRVSWINWLSKCGDEEDDHYLALVSDVHPLNLALNS